LSKLASVILALAAWITAIGSLAYILNDPNGFAFPFRAKYIRHLTLVRIHGVSAALTLLLGPLQWIWPRGKTHRVRGYVYLLSVAVGGFTGLWMATLAYGGLVSKTGFATMAILWWVTGWQAFSAARRRDFLNHQIWMTRNFSLAFGAVVLRGYLGAAQLLGFDFYALYPTSVWAAWMPCLLIAEWRVALLEKKH
jgi:predicted membrane protein DUF2306